MFCLFCWAGKQVPRGTCCDLLCRFCFFVRLRTGFALFIWGSGKGIPGVHVLQSCLMHSPVLFFYCVSISDIYGLLVSWVGESNLNLRAASLWFKVPEAILNYLMRCPTYC